MKQLAIFDLDGTLLNTISDLGYAANHALAKNGFPTHHISSYPHFVGNGITRLIERVLPTEHRTPETVATLRDDFIEYYDEHMLDHTEPYPGIAELLRSLTERGVALAVASNKYQSAVQRLIGHFFPDIPWKCVEGNREGVPTKPDPSVIFAILGDYPTPKAATVMIGDSAVDMETARRAAIDSIGVTWGFGTVEQLTEAYADHIVDTPQAILSIISGE